ncbi:MAG: DUF11 domain-containing protein [Bifidobacteriaceae bacterium]|jgi:uncharacterized repeat protein (TIGR01451 family)|nr:DUF11 domain-containing protein [Bifidobacteriaceae bacterium]
MNNARRCIALALAAVSATVLTGAVDYGDARADDTAEFTRRFDANANGAIITVGNSLLTCPESSTPFCQRAHTGSAYDNNNFAMIQLDVDSDPSTVNSSSSQLALPDGAQVLFAGLYWGARLTAGDQGTAGDLASADTMKLKVPNAPDYVSLHGTILARNTASYNAYESFYDATSLVQSAGNGDYWGADVQAGTGWDRYAGWALTVAYTAPGLPLRNLTVFDGFNTVDPKNTQDITVDGFVAPFSGPVDVQLSMVAYEGDLAQTGDYAKLNSTQLATPDSPGSNFFDSVNSVAGSSVTTRNPAYTNMLGFDIKNLGASGVLDNRDTSATFSFASAGDVYYPGVLGLAINLYAPDLTASTKTAVNISHPNRPANPGDTLQFTLMFANTGQDDAAKVTSCDPLPDGVEYVAGSLLLLGTADPDVTTPVAVPDDGSKWGAYIGATRSVCMNLGRGAGNYNTGEGGTLEVLDATFYQFQATIEDDAGGTTLRNIAHLDYETATTGVSAVYDTPPVTMPVSLKADVKIAKTMTPTEAIAGQSGRTTLVVTNDGPNAATGVTLTDPLPQDYTATAVTWSSTPAGETGTCPVPPVGGTVACDLAQIDPGGQVTVIVLGAPNASSTATTLSNVASVTTDSFDPDLSNNVDTVSIPMTHQADLSIEKTPESATVTPGASVTWTLTATNQCGSDGCLSDATAVVISDTVPDPTKLVLTGATGGAGTGGAAGDVAVTCPNPLLSPSSFQCTVVGDGRMRPGQTAVVTVQGYLLGNATSGPVLNTAAVTSSTFDPNQGNNIDTATLTPGSPVSDIQLIKTGPASAVAGDRIAYTITAVNFGPSDATAVSIVDDLAAAGLVADGVTQATSDRGTCTIAAGIVTCNLGNLPGPNTPGDVGAKATIAIAGALVPPGRTASFTNEATIACGAAPCNEGPSPRPDQPSVTTSPTQEADLAVSKSADTSVVLNADDSATYTVTVTNLGPSTATGVALADTLPPGMTATSMTVTGGGSCDLGASTCAVGSLAPGGSAVATIVGLMGPPGMTGRVQSVEANSNTPDPNSANNTATWTHSENPQADLALTKVSTGLAAGATDNEYTLTVANLGPNSAATPVIVDTLPAGVSITEGEALPAGCSAVGQAVTCVANGTLDDGDEWIVEIPVSIAADVDAGTAIANTATVTSTTLDPSAANNTATVRDSTTADADVRVDFAIGYDVDVTDPHDPVLVTSPPPGMYTGPGSVRFAEIQVFNNGPATAKNVQILSNVAIQAIPDEASLPVFCRLVNQQIVCDLSAIPLAMNSGTYFFVPFTIAPSTPPGVFPDCGRALACVGGPAGGWASVTTTTPETNTANDYDTAALVIADPQTDLHISKTALSTIPNPNDDTHPTYTAGEKFGYQIDLWVPATWDDSEELNLLVADASNVVLDDVLPVGFLATQVNTAQGECDPITRPGPAIHCELGRIAASADASDPQIVRVYVYGTIDPGTTAEISTGTGAVNQAVATSPTLNLSGTASSVSAQAATDVIQQADLRVAKLADAAVSYAGTNVGYTITTLNNGPSDAPNSVVSDTLPLGLTLDTALSPLCGVTGVGVGGGQVVSCTPQVRGEPAGLIPAGTSVNTRIVASTDPRDLRPYWCPGHPNEDGQQCPDVLPPSTPTDEYRPLVNQVEAESGAVDSKPDNNTASVTTELQTLADVAVTASVTTDTPSAGSQITYTLTGVNLGPSAFDYPVVVSTFPPGFVVEAVNAPVMNCATTFTGTGLDAVYEVRCIGWAVTPIRDSFQPGITVPGTVTVSIPPDMPAGPYTASSYAYSRNPVECPETNAGTCESNYDNNRAAVTVNVVESADTSLTKTLVEPNPLVAGAQVVYELTAANAGPSTAQDVTIADTVPEGLTYVSGEVLGGDACPSPDEIDDRNIVKCEAGTIAPNETKTARLVFSVDLHYRGELCNSALVGSGALDLDADNNEDSACEQTVAPPPTDIGVTATPDAGTIVPGAALGYTAVVTNNGPSPTTGTAVTFTVPPGMSGVTVAVAGHTGTADPAATCVAQADVYTCEIGDMLVGDSVTYRVTGTATTTDPADLTLVAHVRHDDADTVPGNDTASAVVHVEPRNTSTPGGGPSTPGGGASTPGGEASTPGGGPSTPVGGPSSPGGGPSSPGGRPGSGDPTRSGDDPGNGKTTKGASLPETGTDAVLPLAAAAVLLILGAAMRAASWRHRPRTVQR